MKIDRHNYEEFFILYWDDELTVTQKQAVESFVKENADLDEEFKLLGETRFTPDNNVQFEEKGFLLNDSFINVTNYEEQLLNYIDDEIKTDQRKEVEKFVDQYPAVQRELSLLQRTKLQPEAEVIFPDKSILYRREEKVRVISMTWFRVAVAAAIILIAGFATFKLVNNSNNSINNSGIAKGSESQKQPANNNPGQSVNNPGEQIKIDSKDNLAKTDETITVQSPNTSKKIEKLPVDKKVDPNPLIAYQPENGNNLHKEKTNADQQSTELIAEANIPKLTKDNHTVQTNQSELDFGNQDVTSNTKLTLYIPEAEQEEKDKGGLKEFLRKTTRAFERRTKIQTTTEDNKLLVGAFAVSLK